jgi:hypothetical protein
VDGEDDYLHVEEEKVVMQLSDAGFIPQLGGIQSIAWPFIIAGGQFC